MHTCIFIWCFEIIVTVVTPQCNLIAQLCQTQHEDLQSEYSKLQESFMKLKEDHKQVVDTNNQEFQRYKQEKENEIATLRGKLLDMFNRYISICSNVC